jgi:flagellar biogenesis protein FliO
MTAEPLVLQTSPIITTGYMMQVLFSLLIVIAIIYVMAKFLLPRLKIAAPGRLIQIVDRVFLEPGVTAYILKVGKKAWLVVASGKRAEKISEIEAE